MWPLLAGGLAASALPAYSQTSTPAKPGAPAQPAPRDASEEEPEVEPAPLGSQWGLELRLQETWDRAPLYGQEGESSSFVDNLGGELTFSRVTSRGQLGLWGTASGLRYHEHSELNTFTYSAGAETSYRASSRTTLSLEEGLTVSYTRDAGVVSESPLNARLPAAAEAPLPAAPPGLTGSGIVLPLSRAVMSTTRGQVAVQASSLVTATMAASYELLRFDSESLVDGSFLRLDSRLERLVGQEQRLQLSYAFERSRVSTGVQPIHTLVAGWSGRLGRRWTAGLSGGVHYLPAVVAVDPVWLPAAMGQLSARFRRGALSFAYEHTVNQAFGLGRQRSADLGSASFLHSLTRRLELSGFGTYGYSRDPLDDSFHFTTRSVGGMLQIELSRGLRTRAVYAWSDSQGSATVPAVRTETATLSLAYGRTWP